MYSDLYKMYDISFEIKPFAVIGTGWANVFKCGIGGDIENYGDRNPAVWMKRGSTQLLITSSINGSINYQR